MSDPDPNAPDSGGESTRWRELVAQLGSEIAAPLTSALERVHALATSGRIDRYNLRALRDELEAARQAGMIGQQLARFGSGRLRQAQERMHLTRTLQGVLSQRARELHARGVTLTQVTRPIEVIADPSLLFGLISGALDWALSHDPAQLEFAVDTKERTWQARLACSFSEAPVEETGALPDSLLWRLVEQTAQTMGLACERSVQGRRATLTLDFPRTIAEEVEGISATEYNTGSPAFTQTKPLAGNQILVVAPRREIRAQVQDALRNLGLIIDYVPSIVEAAEFCREGLPHAILYESALDGERFRALHDEVTGQAPGVVFIEITEDGQSFEISGFGGADITRVGRDVIASSLASALTFELSKNL